MCSVWSCMLINKSHLLNLCMLTFVYKVVVEKERMQKFKLIAYWTTKWERVNLIVNDVISCENCGVAFDNMNERTNERQCLIEFIGKTFNNFINMSFTYWLENFVFSLLKKELRNVIERKCEGIKTLYRRALAFSVAFTTTRRILRFE